MKRLIAAAAFVVATSAHADTRAHMDKELARYSKHALAPVEQFDMVRLDQWQVVGPRQVLLWPAINRVYLVTLEPGCNRLEWANAIGVTQAMHWKVSKTFDFVDFKDQHCKIEEIRPIDYDAVRAEQQAGRP